MHAANVQLVRQKVSDKTEHSTDHRESLLETGQHQHAVCEPLGIGSVADLICN